MSNQEVVYTGSPSSSGTDDSHFVMSEKVQSLAGGIYQEFERMIAKYDEDVVKNLMPLVVNVLEVLDISVTENQEHEVELELLREDNEQLVTQYEREKQLRKATEAKLLEIEDSTDEERKNLQSKVESLESIVRMLELKSKNSADHVGRLEEKDQEMKGEYNKLHSRYTELFKTHMDYMERTKILAGVDRFEHMGGPGKPKLLNVQMGLRSFGSTSFGFSSLEQQGNGVKSVTSPVEVQAMEDSGEVPRNLQAEFQAKQDDSVLESSTETSKNADDSIATTDVPQPMLTPEPKRERIPPVFDLKKTVAERAPSLYQELSFQDEIMGDGDDMTAIANGEIVCVSPSSSEGDDGYPGSIHARERERAGSIGMGREVENLIQENNELLATKNALNIVKDDLIAKVDELTSEHEILREQITSLETVKDKLRSRVQELEEELRKVKEEAAEANAKLVKSDDEDEIPMAQRKRFTRVEMARVLMERNQYKERLMELQEAVRWTEMIRASKHDAAQEADRNKKQSIWKFFSGLFSPGAHSATGRGSPRGALPYGNVHYNAPTSHVAPAPLEAMRRRNLADRNANRRSLDFLDPQASSGKLPQRRAVERREQYKQVRAHVRKDDGRLQAYGWSLPARISSSQSSPALASSGSGAAVTDAALSGNASVSASGSASATNSPEKSSKSSVASNVPVPVPVYCRPLTERDPNMKIWCAAGVNLTGGRTRDGGSIVGTSVFYDGSETCADPADDGSDSMRSPGGLEKEDDAVAKLDRELREKERNIIEWEETEKQLSSLVWICTSTHSSSRVTVIDAHNPADVLESFTVCSSHLLCIASVPGAKQGDYLVTDELRNLCTDEPDPRAKSSEERKSSLTSDKFDSLGSRKSGKDDEEEGAKIGSITFVSCATGGTPSVPSPPPFSPSHEEETKPVLRKLSADVVSDDPESADSRADDDKENEDDGPPQRRLLKEPQGIIKDGISQFDKGDAAVLERVEKMSSVLPTMWLGAQSGALYVHSAVAQWRKCLHSIKLRDSILSIVHVKGRVLVALADGTLAMFQRSADGTWNLGNYHLLDLGQPSHSIRCLAVVHDRVWCGYRNKIRVVDPRTLTVNKTFEAHPRRESQVRGLAWAGDGVWVSIRLDSTLRLYHAHTYHHLQDVDIEPYVSKMLGTGKLGFSFVRITAMLISCHRLWIGTGNGVIISVPLSEGTDEAPNGDVGDDEGRGRLTASIVRVYADGDDITPGSYIPFVNMAQAQLSFHGHRDSVKFFAAVPGVGGMSAASSSAGLSSPGNGHAPLVRGGPKVKPKSMLVLSGGEGYIDFRIVDDGEDVAADSASHLIVWQLPFTQSLSSMKPPTDEEDSCHSRPTVTAEGKRLLTRTRARLPAHPSNEIIEDDDEPEDKDTDVWTRHQDHVDRKDDTNDAAGDKTSAEDEPCSLEPTEADTNAVTPQKTTTG